MSGKLKDLYVKRNQNQYQPAADSWEARAAELSNMSGGAMQQGETAGNGAFGWLKDSFDAGVAGVFGGTARLAGEFMPFGNDTLNSWADYFDDVARRNSPQPGQNLEGIDYVASAVGNALGSGAASALEAGAVAGLGSLLGAGGVAGTVLGGASKVIPGVGKAVQAGKTLWGSPVGKYLVANVAGSPFEAGSEAGNLISDMRKENQQGTANYTDDEIRDAALRSGALNLAWLTGMNMLEAGTLGKITGALGGKMAKDTYKGIAGRALMGGAASGIGEGAEEYGQNLIGDYSKRGNTADFNYDEALEAAKLGAIGGGVLGGVGSGLSATFSKKNSDVTEEIASEDGGTIEEAPEATVSGKEAFINAIAGQESGGNYNAENGDTGAYGKYQIMPSNWPAWAEEAGIGADAPRTPENQEIVARFKLGQYYDKYGARGAAIAWYGGEGALNYSDEALNRKQGDNGEYPSINEYADEVLGRMGNVADSVRIDDTEENYFDESNYTDDTISDSLNPVRGFDVSHLDKGTAQDRNSLLYGERVKKAKPAPASEEVASFNQILDNSNAQKAPNSLFVNSPRSWDAAERIYKARAKEQAERKARAQAIANIANAQQQSFLNVLRNRAAQQWDNAEQEYKDRKQDKLQSLANVINARAAQKWDAKEADNAQKARAEQEKQAQLQNIARLLDARAAQQWDNAERDANLKQNQAQALANLLNAKAAGQYDVAQQVYANRAKEQAEKQRQQQAIANIINARAAQKFDEAETADKFKFVPQRQSMYDGAMRRNLAAQDKVKPEEQPSVEPTERNAAALDKRNMLDVTLPKVREQHKWDKEHKEYHAERYGESALPQTQLLSTDRAARRNMPKPGIEARSFINDRAEKKSARERMQDAIAFVWKDDPKHPLKACRRQLNMFRDMRKEYLQPIYDVMAEGAGNGVSRIPIIEFDNQHRGRFYRQSNNSPWYAKYFKEHKKKPTQKAMYDIAEEVAFGENADVGYYAGVQGKELEAIVAENHAQLDPINDYIQTYESLELRLKENPNYGKEQAERINKAEEARRAEKRNAGETASAESIQTEAKQPAESNQDEVRETVEQPTKKSFFSKRNEQAEKEQRAQSKAETEQGEKLNLPKGTTADVSIVGDNSNIIQVKFNGAQGKGTGGIMGRAGYVWKSDKQLWQARKTEKAMDVAEQLGYTEEAKPQERDYELERTARQQRLQESNERATQSLIAQNKDESVPGKRYTVRNKFFSVTILDGVIRVKDARKINPQDNQYNFSLTVEEYQRAAQNGNRLAGISKLLKAKIREGLENWIEESPNERTKEVRKQQNGEVTLVQVTDEHFEVAYPLIEKVLQKAGIEALDHQTLFERAKKAKPSADTFSKNPDSLFNTNALAGAPKQVTDIIQKMPKAEQSKTTKKQTSTDSTKDVISKELLKSKDLEASARNNTYNDFKIAYFDAVDDYLVDNIGNNSTYAELLKDARFAEKNMEGAAKEAYDFFRTGMEKKVEPKESKVITSDNVADVVESKQDNTEGGKNNANNTERLQSVSEGGTAETVQGLNGKQDIGGVRGQEVSGSNGLLSRNNGATDAGQSGNARGLHGESTSQQYVSGTSERTDKRNDVPQGLTPAQQADAKAEETPGHNFTIKSSSDVADNGKKKKYQGNIAAIKLLKKLESEGRMATPAEQKVLAKYIGWGPVQEVFSPKKYPEWESEYNELKELLTPQEWSAARESVLTAFFTPPAVIDSVYKVVQHLGFKGGKVLDPSMGHGNYFGAMPTRLRKNCMLRGVELDPITGAMAKQLYQDASVEVTGFENAYLDNNSYDLVISNVPFNTNVHPIDRDFKTQNFNLHNYFFAKAVQKARPGGLIVFITSENTMKSDSASLRKYLEGKADFIGAMKLPDTTFKSYSGTAVTSDLIILQKRDESGKPNKYAQEWLDSSFKRIFDKTGTYIAYGDINEYYAKHPGMVIGEWGKGNYSSLIVKGGDLNVADEIAKRAENLPKNIYKPLKGRQENSDIQTSTVSYLKSSMLQQGSLITDENGIPMVKSGNKVIPFGDKSKRTYKKDLQCANDYIRVRDVAKTLLDKQLDPNVSDEELSKYREELNTVYDNFVANNGALNAKGKLLSGDPDYGLICAIENYSYDKTSKKGTATKTAIFTTRTVNAIKPATSAATVNDALALSLSNKGRLDIEYMQELLPNKPTEKEIVKSLGDKVFKDPATDSYVMADEYLSGNVREKLEQAKLAVQTNRDYAKNVKALEKVIPQDWTEKDIKASLGSAWIPAQDVEQFARELMGSKNGTVTFIPSTGTWVVDMKGSDYGVKGTQQYGTSRRAFGDILSAALNQKTIEIKTQGTPDVKESDLANAMVKKVQEEFEKWIWSDESRKKRLLHFYNNNFNATVLRNYDGSMLNLPGYSALAPKLRGHQKDAIWRIIQNGTCLLAHCVGAGKTWTMQAAAMEMKRLGLISKPMFTVPNHMVEQFTNEFRQIYPNAKLLVLTAENLPEIGGGTSKNPAVVKLNKAKRKSTLAKIATEDWDGIIISHELFKRIPMSAKAYEEYYQQQADEIEQALSESADSDENYRTTKELEKKLASAKDKMKKAMNEVGKDLDTPFDKLGIDQIFVDEADLFKNLAFTTNMGRVAGISNSNSQRSQDMYIKTQYLLNTHNGRGVVFATGTPISNSIAEMFTMLRYLNPQALKNAGVSFFDNFISTFSQKESTVEPKPDGNGYRIVQKFTNFYNASGMKRMFREVADVKTQAEINVKIPKLKNGERTVTELDITAPLKQYITTTIKERADSIRNNEVDPSEDNMLKLTSDLRKASLDLRLIDGYQSLPTEIAAPKILAVADNAYNKYVESDDVKGTQLIFCDLSTPKGKSDNELAEGAEEEVLTESEQAANNSVYTNIAKELIRKGIPKNEIAYIHDAKTNEQKEELFAKVRSGEIRILIGSTSKMGAGTNCQRLIVAEHHVDCPWRPRDIEQREGRALRQGNLNDEVEIFTYVTKDSFDTNMWEKVKTKSQMIGQAMNSDLTINEIEDIGADTLSYAEIQGLASGDPFVPRRIAVSAELNSLRNQYREYEDNRKTNERTIRDSSSYILALEKEAETAKKDAEKLRNVIGENFSIVIAGKTFTKFAEAEKVLEGINQKVGSASVIKGNLAGLDFKLYYMPKGTEYRPSYKNSIEWNRTASLGGYVAEFASSDPNACYISLGKLRAMVNMVTNGIPSVAKIAEEEIRKNKAAIKEAKEALNLPFDKEAEYKKLLEEEKVIAKHFDAIEKAANVGDNYRFNRVFSTKDGKEYRSLGNTKIEDAGGNSVVMLESEDTETQETVWISSDEIENTVSPSNTQYSVSYEAVQRAKEEVEAEIRAAFPNGKVEYVNGVPTITMPNGSKFQYSIRENIVVNAKEQRKADAAHGTSGARVQGFWKKFTGNGVQRMLAVSKNSERGTAFHEAMHAAIDLVLTEKEKNALYNYYEKKTKEQNRDVDEVIADAYRDWVLARQRKSGTMFGKLWRKVKDFCTRIKAIFDKGAEVERIMQDIESGRVYERGTNNHSVTKRISFSKEEIQGQKGSGTTQVATTRTMYVKALKWLRNQSPEAKTVLDYGAGLGLGTDDMRSNNPDLNIDCYEPNPERWAGKQPPTYTNNTQINKDYDLILNTNVLNVVEKPIRDLIVKDIADHLTMGGKALITTRGWSNDVNAAKNFKPADEHHAIWINKGKNGYVFQKGFDGDELKNYIEELLGDEFVVEKTRPTFGKSSVTITRVKAQPNKSAKQLGLFDTDSYQEMPDSYKTLKGSVVKRSKYGVGKQMGSQVYLHKDYVSDVIPKKVWENALKVLSDADSDFEYNCVMYDTKTGNVRFDEAPDFDEAREPIVGDTITVKPDGTVKRGHSNYIWHHKWLWVKNDYQGFDVNQSKAWSNKWLGTLTETADGNGIERWNTQLDRFNLEHDGEEVHYSVASPKHKIANAFTNTERKGVVDSVKDFFKEHRKSLYQDWFDKNNPLKGFDALTKATGGLSVYDQVQSLPATTAGMLKALTEGTAQHVKMANQHLKNVKMKYNVTLAMALEKIDKKQMDKAYPKYLAENGFDNWVNALGAYLGAERCLEMARLARAEGKTYKFPKGLTEQECQDFVNKAPQQFKAAADIFYKVNDNVISIMEDAEVFSHDLAKTLRTKYRKYCPLLRDFSDTAAADSFIGGLTEGGRGIGNVSIPLKRINIEGSERGVLNPLETILKSYAVMLNRAERNKVALMAVENSRTADLHELIQEVPGTTADPKNCVFTVLINGKKKAYKTTQDLYGPIVGYNLPAANLAFGVARTAARMLRTGATMSPSFILRNVLRDTVFAGISSKNGFIPIVDTIRGAIALAKDPAMRAEFEAAGVTEYNFYSSQKSRIKSLDAMAGETPASAWEIMKAVFSRLEATSDFFESSTRMGEYMKARQKGLSMEEAARAAREVTLDFSRSGRVGEQVNQVVPFFNACLQGGDKMVRLFREDFVGTSLKVLKYIVLPSLLIMAMNWDEDWYKDLDPDIKNNYWCLGRNIRIPKPQEAGVLFGSGIEALFQQAADKDKEAVSNFLKAFSSNMMPSVLPTLILPLIEWSANYSFFKGRPLVGNKYSRLPDELQYNDYTSELSKGIGSAFKLSPMKIDNLVRGYTGTMGALLWSMAGEPFAKANNLPAKHFSELPFVRDFNVTDANLSRPMNEFYGILDKANRQHAGYGVKGKPEAAVKGIRSAGAMISKIRKDIDKITHSNLTPERKRELIDKRKEKMNQIAKQATARYGKYFE